MENIKILIAEDDEDNFFFLKVSLRPHPFEILRARNGKEAVEIIRQDPQISIVLMDLKMPDMDGYEATRSIKQIRPELPVIAVTAYAMTGDEAKTLEAGCDGYLSKPFSRDQILEVMSRHINIS